MHESYHEYELQHLNTNNRYLYHLYKSNGVVDTVKTFKYYPTSDIILNNIDTFFLKFAETKVYLDNNAYSSTAGIYGLLEEFNAYSQDAFIMNYVYNFYRTKNVNKSFWNDYCITVKDLYKKQLILSYFIYQYLWHVKNSNINLFNKIQLDGSLIRLFKKIDNNFKNNLNNLSLYYLELLNEIQPEIKFSISILENEIVLIEKKVVSSSGYKLFL